MAFCRALRKNREIRDLPFYVLTQMVELDPAPDQDIGRIDIVFLPTGLQGSPNEAIYFCLECKRLNVVIEGRKRPGGSEYVVHGMLRFLNGQYARAVRNGGMLGYVLDGDVSAAIENIEANIRSHCTILCMDAPGVLHPSSVLTDVAIARESFHQRQIEPAHFCVHHLFVKANSIVYR